MISLLGSKVFLSVPKNNGMIRTFKVVGMGQIPFPDIDISDPSERQLPVLNSEKLSPQKRGKSCQ